MFKKLSFIFVLLLSSILGFSSLDRVSAAGCGTVYIDNDDPNHYTYHTGWTYQTSSSSFRGDHRIIKTSPYGYYDWVSSVRCTNDFYIDVYLNNVKFNNPRALYNGLDKDFIFNQNTAPAGWSRVGFASSPYSSSQNMTVVKVSPYGTTSTASTYTGADGIRIIQTNFTASSLLTSSSLTASINDLKDQVHSKMLNSIDLFENVKGSFNYWSKPAGFNYSVEYNVKSGSKPSSKMKIIEYGQDVVESAYDGESSVILLKNSKEYIKHNRKLNKDFIANERKQLGEKAKDRYIFGEDNEKIYLYKTDYTNMNAAKDSLFPQEIALGYLEDYSKWDIFDDSIQYLGLDAALIEGTFNNYYETKHQASTFKLWVHKDTGVLLKMEEYNNENEVVSSLVTQEIKFNNKSNNTNFQLEIPSGFKVKSK